jgi:hypothetical protein
MRKDVEGGGKECGRRKRKDIEGGGERILKEMKECGRRRRKHVKGEGKRILKDAMRKNVEGGGVST